MSWDESSSCSCGGQYQGGDGEDGEADALGFVELGLDVANAKPGYGDAMRQSPMAVWSMASRMIIPTTELRFAPRAMRMPISEVRRATV